LPRSVRPLEPELPELLPDPLLPLEPGLLPAAPYPLPLEPDDPELPELPELPEPPKPDCEPPVFELPDCELPDCELPDCEPPCEPDEPLRDELALSDGEPLIPPLCLSWRSVIVYLLTS
jgi:hypothetical protein